jgi:hypothetical protein
MPVKDAELFKHLLNCPGADARQAEWKLEQETPKPELKAEQGTANPEPKAEPVTQNPEPTAEADVQPE